MIIDQETNGVKVLTDMSHGARGNPHPQYQNNKTYKTKANISGTNYVKIFDGDFQSKPNNFPVRNRQYNRLLYSAYIYSMSNDDLQTVTRLTFFAITKYNGEFAVDVQADNILGNTFKVVVAYKDVSEGGVAVGNKAYNLKVYIRLTRSNERATIRQEMYDVCSNYEVPFHLECSYSGANWNEKLNALYKDLGTRELLTETELNAEIQDYTTLERDTSNMSLSYDYVKKGMYLLCGNKAEKLVTNVDFLSSNSNAKIGNSETPWVIGYFKTINLKIYNTIATLPDAALDGTISILSNSTQKLLVFKADGHWYNAMGTQLK